MHPVLREATASLLFVIMGVQSVAAQTPFWWTEQSVIMPGAQPDDFAALNQGQLKALASAAHRAMEQRFNGGSGSTIRSMIQNWQSPGASTEDFAAVTAGQLKSIARPFYDRLNQVSGTSGYPWSSSTSPSDDFSVVNIGQAKRLFAFHLPSTPGTGGDALPSVWNGNLTSINLGNASEPPISPLTDLPPGTPKTYSGDLVFDKGPWSTNNLDGYTTYEPVIQSNKKWSYITGSISPQYDLWDTWAVVSDPSESSKQRNIIDTYSPNDDPPIDEAGWLVGSYYSPSPIANALDGGRRNKFVLEDEHGVSITSFDAVCWYHELYFKPGTALTYSINRQPGVPGSGDMFNCPVAKDFRAMESPDTQYGGNGNYMRLVLPSMPIDNPPKSNILGGGAPPSNTNKSYTYNEEPVPISAFSYSDAAGARYRKIGLNGVPLPDAKPQQQDESGEQPEETYIDAFTRHLQHSVTDVYTSIPSGLLALQVKRQVIPEVWSRRFGMRPNERYDRPFGAGWTSSICSSIIFAGKQAAVTDHQGSRTTFQLNEYRDSFGNYRTNWVPTQEAAGDAKPLYCKLAEYAQGYIHYDKFGARCYYERVHEIKFLPGKGNTNVADFTTFDDRVRQLDGTTHFFFRLAKVEDRWGNKLHYEYVGTGSQIPSLIVDPDRPAMRISIHQQEGLITRIQGPSGEIIHYEYEDLDMPQAPAVPSHLPNSTIPVEEDDANFIGEHHKILNRVWRETPGQEAAVSEVVYEYDADVERDPTPNPADMIRTIYYHIDVSSIRDERDHETRFSYRQENGSGNFVRGFQFDQYTGNAIWDIVAREQVGRPRALTKVTLADQSETTFASGQSARMGVYGHLYDAGNAAAWTEVSGAKVRYSYKFTSPWLFHPHYKVNGVVQFLRNQKVLSFTEMILRSAPIITPGETSDAQPTEERFTFNPAAGMALAETTDASGNKTIFGYTDIADQIGYDWDTYFDDPTSETNALHLQPKPGGGQFKGVKRYRYDAATRVMTSVTDENGIMTAYTLKPAPQGQVPTGLRTRETVYDTHGSDDPEDFTTLKITDFEYENDDFKGFMTRKKVRTTGMSVPQGEPQPIGEMITDYVADSYGRIKDEMVHASEDDPATAENEEVRLITSYTYTLGGQKATVTDPRGHVTHFSYYPNTLRLRRVTHPDTSFKELFYDAHGNIEKEVNEAGFITWHEYDELNRKVKTVFDLDGNGQKGGRCTIPAFPVAADAVPEYEGDLVTETSYNDQGLPEDQVDVRGIATHHDYDDLGRIKKTTVNASAADPAQRAVTLYADDNQTTPDFVGGSVFDVSGFKPLHVTDPRGFTTTFEYDKLYRETKRTLVDGSYRQVASSDEKNWADTGRWLQGAQNPNWVDPLTLNITVQTRYDNVGNKLQTIDPLGRVTRAEYDAFRRPVTVELPSTAGITNPEFPVLPAFKRMRYTVHDQVWRTEDEMGTVTHQLYDNAGRPVRTLLPAVPDGSLPLTFPLPLRRPEMHQAYDAAGNVVQTKDARGNITDTVYDNRNRPTQVLAPPALDAASGTVVRLETLTAYDSLGKVTHVTDPLNHVTETRYDRAGRPSVVIAPPVITSLLPDAIPVPIITRTIYDANGNALLIQRPKGIITTNSYDALNRLVTTQRAPDVPATTFGYDLAGNRTRVTDGKGNTTLLTYDAQNRVVKEYYPEVPGKDSSIITHSYNAAHEVGRFQSVTQGIRFHYDVRGQLRRINHQATISQSGQPFESRTYNAAGRLVQTQRYGDAGLILAPTSMSYDALGRVQTETSAGKMHQYHYDPAGNLTLFQPGTGRQISRQYDALNRLTQLTDGGRVTQTGYDRAGRAFAQTAANGGKQRNLYDAQGRLMQRTLLTRHGVPLVDFQWRHDAHGNVIRQSEGWYPGASDVVGTTQTKLMEYDSADRLVGELTQPAVAGAPVKQTVHGFDHADNRETQTEFADGVPTKTTTYQYNQRNQLVEWTVVETGVRKQRVMHHYDNVGRCYGKQYYGTTDAVLEKLVSFHFNDLDELTKAVWSNGHDWIPDFISTEIKYQYDYRHRRLERDCTRSKNTLPSVPLPGFPKNEKLLTTYSGGLSVADYPAAEPGGSSYSVLPEAEYVRGPDMGGGVGGMLYSLRRDNGEGTPPLKAKYSLSNGRGDIVAQSDSAGVLTWAASYEAYGKRTHEAGENKDRQRANTKDEETEFGILNEGFRYRDIETGVWLSRDPAGFVDGPNLYAYVKQNPWTGFDPHGLAEESAVSKALKERSELLAQKQEAAGSEDGAEAQRSQFKRGQEVASRAADGLSDGVSLIPLLGSGNELLAGGKSASGQSLAPLEYISAVAGLIPGEKFIAKLGEAGVKALNASAQIIKKEADQVVEVILKQRASASKGLTGRFSFYDVVDAKKAQGYHDGLLEYFNKHSRGSIKWVDETPAGSGGQFIPETGDILISNIYRTNAAAKKSLLGLRVEELLHFKQVHQRGLLGRTSDEIDTVMIDTFEGQISPLMELNGFKPSN